MLFDAGVHLIRRAQLSQRFLHAKRTVSPLTPALSPLRGEGAARAGFVSGDIDGREGCVLATVSKAPSRRTTLKPASACCASPSPLNGERAGVRRETVPSCNIF